MTLRTLKVLDAAVLQRRSVIVLELDAPSPLLGVADGMPMELIFQDGGRWPVQLKSVGFASSTPDHAHVIVSLPTREDTGAIAAVEFEEAPPSAGARAARTAR